MKNNQRSLLSIVINNPRLFHKINNRSLFSDKYSKYIYDIMMQLSKTHTYITEEIIREYLIEQKQDLVQFNDLVKTDHKEKNFKHYLYEVVIEKLKLDIKVIANENKSLNDLVEDILNVANRNIDLVDTKTMTTQELCRSLLEDMMSKERKLIYSGLNHIDSNGGYEETDLIYIGARPSEGKTTLAEIAILNQLKAKLKICMITLEMTEKKIISHLACAKAGIDTLKYKTGTMTNLEKEKFLNAVDWIYQSDFYITMNKTTINDIEAYLYDMKRKHNIDCFYIDYVQLIKNSGVFGRTEQIENISNRLKRLALKIKTPVVALAQLNREVEGKERPPRLSDFKGSGAIEQDADICCLIHTINHEYSKNIRLVDLRFDKVRDGQKGVDRVKFYVDIKQMILLKWESMN